MIQAGGFAAALIGQQPSLCTDNNNSFVGFVHGVHSSTFARIHTIVGRSTCTLFVRNIIPDYAHFTRLSGMSLGVTRSSRCQIREYLLSSLLRCTMLQGHSAVASSAAHVQRCGGSQAAAAFLLGRGQLCRHQVNCSAQQPSGALRSGHLCGFTGELKKLGTGPLRSLHDT